MPSSKRPSPGASMDSDDAAPAASADSLRASPPRSRKRSSRASPRRRTPNPNPRPRTDLYGTEPSRKSERKPKPRSFPDAAPPPPPRRPTSPSASAPGAAASNLWTHADELALLTGAAAFRAGSGRAPRLPDTGPLFESIRGSLSAHIDQAKLYYKLKRLKSKFCNTALSATSTDHDRTVRDLSHDVWGADLLPPAAAAKDATEYATDYTADAEEEEEEEDRDDGYEAAPAPDVAVLGPRLPLVRDLLGEYWTRNAGVLSGVSLERGLARLPAEEGRVAETKWRRQLDAEMRTQMRRHDLAKEVLGLLIDTVKGLGP